MSYRQTASRIFSEALDQLEISKVMQAQLRCEAGVLHVAGVAYRLGDFRRIGVVSVGKAAIPMAEALIDVLGTEVRSHQTLEAVVVGPAAARSHSLRYFVGGHPLPNEHSFAAADTVLRLLDGYGWDDLIFFLISGGASAMLESPLDPAMTCEDTSAFHQTLVHSGLSIREMNALRKHFSAVKGGRLAVAAGMATQCTLLVSDVPRDALDVIGSGPSMPDPCTVADCREILAKHREALPFSDKVSRFFAGTFPETPKWNPAFLRSSVFALLSSDDLCYAARKIAENEGFYVVIDNSCDEWAYDSAAVHLLKRMVELRKTHDKVCLLSAGEISVKVQGRHGVGGRNQHLVLECARHIARSGQRVTVLSAGSDGIDGNSMAAGAVADESTVARARALNLDIDAALAQFDSNTIFAALGDALVTGPTGNNVRDLRILMSAD